MKPILNYLREKPEFYVLLRRIYGKTVGLYWLKEIYLRKIGLFNGLRRVKLVSNEEANKTISKKIESSEPFMIARYGSTEFRNLFVDNMENLHFYSGFFPNDKKLLKRFREVYFESSGQIDYLCVWNYKNHFFKKIKLIRNLPNIKCFFDVESLDYRQKWIQSLENKKILVIHPFRATIEKQMKKREQLGILPPLKKLEIIRAVQTLAGNSDPRFKDWFAALDYMKKEIDKKDFDIALIGAGAYGLPLAAYIKEKGKKAIHIGGGLQLFFGIKGKRWETSQKIDTNKYWIYPLESDKIENLKKIEGGAYW